MSITLGSNIASLQAQRQLFKTEQNLSSVFERLSSGQRINRASDDAAGLAISESLNTDRRVFNQAIRNLNDGLSVLNIADSTVAELSGIVIRIQELAEQAANGSLSSTQRKSLDAEAQELKNEFFRVSRSADFNGLRLFDGSIENGVRLQAGYGEDGSIFSSLGGQMGDGSFALSGSTMAGEDPWALESGDLNRDGHLDVVVTNVNSDHLMVLLGRGDGSFQNAATISGTPSAYELAIEDVTGDSALDLIVTSRNEASVLLFTGRGDGSFSEAQTFTVGSGPVRVRAEDLNQDGIVDLFTSNQSSDDLSVLYGSGGGSFEAARTFNAGNTPKSVIAGDVDGDNVLDLISANYGDDTFSVLLGNADGTFGSGQSFDAGDRPIDALSDDVNGDGIIDITTGNYGGFFSVSLGNGDGTFQSAKTYSAIGRSYNIELVDLNSDGIKDYVGSTFSSGVSVVLGNSDGSFGSPANAQASSGPIYDFAVGDFDSDGVNDIVAALRNVGRIETLAGGTREGIAPILDFSLQTQSDALQALAPLGRKLQSLSEQRGTIGAFQSRLQSALNTLSATSENYAAAESRIKDADIAFESSQLTRLNILQQAAAAVLGQANQQPALALQLLS